MKKVILYIWQLPQNLLALFTVGIFKMFGYKYEVEKSYPDITTFWFDSLPQWFSGVSLGNYIILRKCFKNHKTWWHEFGHCRQSKIFGPLYLFVVGLPSITNNLIARKSEWFMKNYYKLYPEKWADKLGGVIRK